MCCFVSTFRLNFLNFFLLSISSCIALSLENIFCVISILLNLLGLFYGLAQGVLWKMFCICLRRIWVHLHAWGMTGHRLVQARPFLVTAVTWLCSMCLSSSSKLGWACFHGDGRGEHTMGLLRPRLHTGHHHFCLVLLAKASHVVSCKSRVKGRFGQSLTVYETYSFRALFKSISQLIFCLTVLESHYESYHCSLQLFL